MIILRLNLFKYIFFGLGLDIVMHNEPAYPMNLDRKPLSSKHSAGAVQSRHSPDSQQDSGTAGLSARSSPLFEEQDKSRPQSRLREIEITKLWIKLIFDWLSWPKLTVIYYEMYESPDHRTPLFFSVANIFTHISNVVEILNKHAVHSHVGITEGETSVNCKKTYFEIRLASHGSSSDTKCFSLML